jgi:excisionase family DNA binding protein
VRSEKWKGTIMATTPDPRTRQTISVPEAAELIGMNPRTVYNAVDRGECPAIRVGRTIRIPTAEFLAHYRIPKPVSHETSAA